jgi:hypothetical protein
MRILFLILISFSCFADFSQVLRTTNRNLKTFVDVCKKQNQDIVKPAFQELAKPVNNTEYVKLTVDRKGLTQLLENFKLESLSTDKEVIFRELLLKDCNEKKLMQFRKFQKEVHSCRHAFDTYHFMEALVYSYGSGAWDKEIKQQLSSLILKYVRQEGMGKTTILAKLMGFDILIEAAKYGIINKDLTPQIAAFQNRSEAEHASLVAKLREDRAKERKRYTCKQYQNHIRSENDLNLKMKKRIEKIFELIGKE